MTEIKSETQLEDKPEISLSPQSRLIINTCVKAMKDRSPETSRLEAVKKARKKTLLSEIIQADETLVPGETAISGKTVEDTAALFRLMESVARAEDDIYKMVK